MSSSNKNNKPPSPKAPTDPPDQLPIIFPTPQTTQSKILSDALAEAMETPLFSEPVKAPAKPSTARNAGPSTIPPTSRLFPSTIQLLKDLRKDFKKHLDDCDKLSKLIADQKNAYEKQFETEAKWEDESKPEKKTEGIKEVAGDEPEDLEGLDRSSQALSKAVEEENKKLEEARKNEKNLESENK